MIMSWQRLPGVVTLEQRGGGIGFDSGSTLAERTAQLFVAKGSLVVSYLSTTRLGDDANRKGHAETVSFLATLSVLVFFSLKDGLAVYLR